MKVLPVLLAVLFVGCSSIERPKAPIEVDLRSSRVLIGSVEGVFNAFSKIGTTTEDIQVFYFPKDDVVCLEVRHNFTNFYQFWDKENRETYIKGLEQYKQDYEQRKLGKKNSSTRRHYGVVKGYFIWETSKISGQGFSYPNIELGYQFKNNAPYFSVNTREADNTNPTTAPEPSFEQNPNLCIYLTRALADDLAALFDYDLLRSFARGAVDPNKTKDKETKKDDY